MTRITEVDLHCLLHDAQTVNNKLRTEIERLRAELAKHQWQPIETAPRDGATILLYLEWHDGVKEIIVGKAIQAKVFIWDCGGTRVSATVPTHWMPLPEPPKEKGNG